MALKKCFRHRIDRVTARSLKQARLVTCMSTDLSRMYEFSSTSSTSIGTLAQTSPNSHSTAFYSLWISDSGVKDSKAPARLPALESTAAST